MISSIALTLIVVRYQMEGIFSIDIEFKHLVCRFKLNRRTSIQIWEQKASILFWWGGGLPTNKSNQPKDASVLNGAFVAFRIYTLLS